MTLKELLQKRRDIVEEYKKEYTELLKEWEGKDDEAGFNDEERKRFKRFAKKVNAVNAEIKKLEKKSK